MNINRPAHLGSSPPFTAAILCAQEAGNKEATEHSFLGTRIRPSIKYSLSDTFTVGTILQNSEYKTKRYIETAGLRVSFLIQKTRAAPTILDVDFSPANSQRKRRQG